MGVTAHAWELQHMDGSYSTLHFLQFNLPLRLRIHKQKEKQYFPVHSLIGMKHKEIVSFLVLRQARLNHDGHPNNLEHYLSAYLN
jgi:hypothetical protein